MKIYNKLKLILWKVLDLLVIIPFDVATCLKGICEDHITKLQAKLDGMTALEATKDVVVTGIVDVKDKVVNG